MLDWWIGDFGVLQLRRVDEIRRSQYELLSVVVVRDCVGQAAVVRFVIVDVRLQLAQPLLVPRRPFAHLGQIAQVEMIGHCKSLRE